MKRRIFAVATFALLAIAPSAFAAGKGSSMLAIGLGQAKANIPVVFGLQFDETNVGAQYWYLFSDDYAFTASGAIGFGNIKFEDTTPPADEEKYTLSGFRFRVGGDRIGQIGDRFTMYMGPGLEYQSAKVTFEETGFPDVESESATTFGINGRIGGVMMLSDAIGIAGEISHSFGFASYEEGPDELTWMPNSVNAFWGLTFTFGGN
jgi:hypothetical protein